MEEEGGRKTDQLDLRVERGMSLFGKEGEKEEGRTWQSAREKEKIVASFSASSSRKYLILRKKKNGSISQTPTD